MGGLARRLLTPFFQKIRVDQESADRLSQAHSKGVVVHVLRVRRVMDPLFILYALDRLGLPEPEWMHDHATARESPTVQSLTQIVESGASSLLFLRRPKTLMSPSTSYSERHVEALVGLQRHLERPILLLPETLLWTKRPVGVRRTIVDAIFGDREAPGRLREMLGFFWHHADSRFHVGAPVDLRAVLEREQGQTDRVIAKKVRWSILHHLSREEELRTGPMHRSAARTRQMVLKDATVRKHIANQVKPGVALEDAEKKADHLLRTIAADMRYGWLRVLDAVVDAVWNRIYDGIVVDEAGLARVRRAARRGPVVLVPSHKSHVDYLVLSQVFFRDGLIPPHVAAGDNLNFPPIGFIFRRSGAFFIRRTFKGDKLYAVVFAAYVRRLLKEGHAIEFFIEGGRSRTGKLLPPRMGMLSMCVDPVLDGAINDVFFIPVSIGYEKIIEAGSYARELHGGEKKKEDMGALLSSTKVLRSKYGRVYVDFAEPISLRVFAASRAFEIASKEQFSEPTEEPTVPERKVLVTQLGHRIVVGINEVTRVTPTSIAAMILLSRQRRGVAQTELYSRADRVIDFLHRVGARTSRALEPDARRAALREALGRFAADNLVLMTPAPDGETIYQMNDEGRRALDYYKNNILHFFVPYAVVAAALLVNGGEQVALTTAQASARRISRLVKNEVSFRVDRGFEENFDSAAELLISRRTIEQRGSEGTEPTLSITRVGRPEALELAGLLAVFFEAYRLAAETLEETTDAPVSQKKLIAMGLDRAKRQVLEGRVARAEAASQPTLQAAFAWFGEEGITGKETQVQAVDEGRRNALITELTGYLRSISAGD